MARVAVVILNWNGKKHLKEFLPSVLKFSSPAKIYVIDNASSDDSVAFLQLNYPTISIIQNQENSGFAGGYNEGLKQVEEEYFILLNSDVEVTENWINPVIDLLESNSNFVAAQPIIASYLKKDYFEHAGAAGGFMDRDLYPFCRGRIFGNIEKNEGQYSTQQEIFWATGACLFIKKTAFNEVNGFDSSFFAHMEEIDLCYRLKNKGYQIFCSSSSVVYHLGGGTLNYDNPRKTYLNFRNNLFLIHKNYFDSILFFKIFRRLCLDGIAALRFLYKGKFSHFTSVIKAHFSYYVAITRLNYARRENKKQIRFNRVGLYSKSILLDYFLRGKKKFSELNSSDY